jgi:peptidoglycan/LPS O-acetylase OafA/YrhL
MTVIYVVYLVMGNFIANLENKPLAYFLVYSIVAIFTVALASLSYWAMETKILAMKEKYQRIKSST